jgi:hypothetical protein
MGVTHGDQGFGFPAAAGQPPVAGTLAVWVLPAATAADVARRAKGRQPAPGAPGFP